MVHYKDDAPLGTVERIRGSLSGLGVLAVEDWGDSVEGVSSLRLSIAGLDGSVGVNGKGRTRPLALASAYGEFAERLSNQLLYVPSFFYDFDPALAAEGGFAFDPRERRTARFDPLSCLPRDFLPTVDLSGADSFGDGVFDFCSTGGETYLVPYAELGGGGEAYLPIVLSLYLYGSNGMCSGNSREEALAQGLSEVFERYAIRRVLTEGLCPPDIPRDVLREAFPDECAVVDWIEASGDFRVLVKDCSLGEGLPVVASVLVDLRGSGYFVDFGAHPDLRIAFERSLTELFQNRSLRNFRSFVPFDSADDAGACGHPANVAEACKTGRGKYPASFFGSGSPDPALPGRLSRSFADNGACLDYMTGLARSLGWRIFVRDATCLGQPAYHVVVPGISDMKAFGAQEFYYATRRSRLASCCRRLADLTPAETEESLQLLESELAEGRSMRFREMSRVPFLDSSPLAALDARMLAASMRHAAGDGRGAAAHLAASAEAAAAAGSEDLALHFRCARDYLRLAGDAAGGAGLLGALYPEATVRAVVRDFGERGAVLREIGTLPCPDCTACRYRAGCGYPVLRELHRAFKGAVAASGGRP